MLDRPTLLNAACLLLLFACAGCESLARWKAEQGVALRRERADAIAASIALPRSERRFGASTDTDTRLLVTRERVVLDRTPGLARALAHGEIPSSLPASPVELLRVAARPIDPESFDAAFRRGFRRDATGFDAPPTEPQLVWAAADTPVTTLFAIAATFSGFHLGTRTPRGFDVRSFTMQGGGSPYPVRIGTRRSDRSIAPLAPVPAGTFDARVGTRESDVPRLVLEVLLEREGVVIAADQGYLRSGCTEVETGVRPIAVPHVHGSLDRAGLARCLEAVHARRPDERDAVLRVARDAALTVQDFVDAWDVLAGTEAAPLFPVVHP